MTPRRPNGPPKPIDAEILERLAIAYLGRYATSRARLERYLRSKIEERGGDLAALDPVGLADRLVALGYVDDGAVAEARGRSVARRGLGARRLAASLDALGIAAEDRVGAMEEARRTEWQDALRFAARRKIGPFAKGETDHPARERALAAMLRAGHAFALARRIVSCPPGIVPQRDE